MKKSKRILSVLFVLLILIMSAPAAFAEDATCTHSLMRYVYEGQSRMLDNGKTYLCIAHWFCPDCQKHFADFEATQELTSDQLYFPCPHSKLKLYAEGKTGLMGYLCIEHWECQDCQRCFADAAAAQELTYDQIYVIPCPHNKLIHCPEGAFSDDHSPYYLCPEHWECRDCHLYFADAAATQELTQLYTIPCTHKDIYYDDGQAPKCGGENGSIGHWHCPHCDQNFSDQAATQRLTYSEIYSVVPSYSEHEVLYNLPFEESSDRCWASFDFYYSLLLIFEPSAESSIDRQQGIATFSRKLGEYTETQTYSLAYCTHCGVFLQEHTVLTNQSGIVLAEEHSDSNVNNYGYGDGFIGLHQPGSIESELLGYTEMPTSTDGLAYGEAYFDLEAVLKDVLEEFFGNELEEGAESYYQNFVEYLSVAKVYFNEDRSQLKAVFPDNYILEGTLLQDYFNGVDYVRINTNTCAHSWDGGVVTKIATETETGIFTYTCTSCKETRTETIPMLTLELLEEISKKKSLKDTSDDGTVFFDESANIPANTIFDFEVLQKTDRYETIDLKLTADGRIVEPENPVWVKIPVPAGWEPEGITIWHGSEQLPFFVENGYIFFCTSHFSEFQLKYEAPTHNEGENQSQTPDQPAKKLNFFQRIIQWFRNLFAKLFGKK